VIMWIHSDYVDSALHAVSPVCCSVLQCVAVCRSVLQWIALSMHAGGDVQ